MTAISFEFDIAPSHLMYVSFKELCLGESTTNRQIGQSTSCTEAKFTVNLIHKNDLASIIQHKHNVHPTMVYVALKGLYYKAVWALTM